MNLSEVTITITIRMIQNLLKINCFEYDHNTKIRKEIGQKLEIGRRFYSIKRKRGIL